MTMRSFSDWLYNNLLLNLLRDNWIMRGWQQILTIEMKERDMVMNQKPASYIRERMTAYEIRSVWQRRKLLKCLEDVCLVCRLMSSFWYKRAQATGEMTKINLFLNLLLPDGLSKESRRVKAGITSQVHHNDLEKLTNSCFEEKLINLELFHPQSFTLSNSTFHSRNCDQWDVILIPFANTNFPLYHFSVARISVCHKKKIHLTLSDLSTYLELNWKTLFMSVKM